MRYLPDHEHIMALASRESDVCSQLRYLNSSSFFPFPLSASRVPCPINQCLGTSGAGFPQGLMKVDVERVQKQNYEPLQLMLSQWRAAVAVRGAVRCDVSRAMVGVSVGYV